MERLTNYHLITVKFLGQTDKSPTRIKLTSERFKKSVIVSKWQYADEKETAEIAPYILTLMGFNIIGQAEGKGVNYIITDTFKTLSINDII